MTDTLVQNLNDSSKQLTLQQCILSKYLERQEKLGSPLYKSRLKKDTVQPGLVVELVQSAVRCSENASTEWLTDSWQTARRSDGSGGPAPVRMVNDRAVRFSKTDGQNYGLKLADQARLIDANEDSPIQAGWASPLHSDKKNSRRTTTEDEKWNDPNHRLRSAHTLLDVATLAGAKRAWTTPTTKNQEQGQAFWNEAERTEKRKGINLLTQVARTVTDQPHIITTSGQIQTISTVGTDTTDPSALAVGLNPQLSAYLMGIPDAVLHCVYLVTESLSHRRKRSSKATSKPK